MRKRISKTLRKNKLFFVSFKISNTGRTRTVRERGENIKTKYFFAERNIA